jgi:hypothetical protein
LKTEVFPIHLFFFHAWFIAKRYGIHFLGHILEPFLKFYLLITLLRFAASLPSVRSFGESQKVESLSTLGRQYGRLTMSNFIVRFIHNWTTVIDQSINQDSEPKTLEGRFVLTKTWSK